MDTRGGIRSLGHIPAIRKCALSSKIRLRNPCASPRNRSSYLHARKVGGMKLEERVRDLDLRTWQAQELKDPANGQRSGEKMRKTK